MRQRADERLEENRLSCAVWPDDGEGAPGRDVKGQVGEDALLAEADLEVLDLERDLPLTGLDFLRAKAAIARVPRAEIDRALALVDLPPPSARDPIGTLSGGQFQRLLLAFALLTRPNVLLFDEPTAGVDQPGEEILYEAIRRLQQEEGLTLLLVSHELSIVYQYASAVLCLGRGRPCFGPPDAILTPEVLAQAYDAPVRFHRHDAHD